MLSPRVTSLITRCFAERDREAALRCLLMLDEGLRGTAGDRVMTGMLKCSRGSLKNLLDAVALAETDWRDLLVAADLAHDVHAHETWSPDW